MASESGRLQGGDVEASHGGEGVAVSAIDGSIGGVIGPLEHLCGAVKAMLLAAGLGTRLAPLTSALPKPMMPVLDRPALAHIVDGLERQGYGELLANLHHHPDVIRGWFGDRCSYLRRAELLGTAGGVRNVAGFFGDEPILVVSGDP